MTTETVVDLTPALVAPQRYAAKLLLDAEDADSNDFEFITAHHFTWETGSESVSMTALVTALQPTPGHFNLRLDFDGNGSEVFRLAYCDRIIAWAVELLKSSGWEIVVSTNSEQKAWVTYDEGFTFFVRRPSVQR